MLKDAPAAAQYQRPLGAGSVALVLLTVVLWGANPVAVRFSVDTLPPLAVSGLRFLMASLVMAVWCLVVGAPFRCRREQLRPIVICGLLLYVQITTFTVGVWLSNASHTTLLINVFPLGVVALEHLVWREDRLPAGAVAGVALAAAGALLVFFTDRSAAADQLDAPSLTGDVVLLASALLLSVKIVYTKRAVRQVPAATLIFWHDVIGTVLFFSTSAALFVVSSGAWERIEPGAWTAPAVLGLCYQGFLVAGVCFGIQAYLLTRHRATHISVFNFATPLVGIAAAVLLRHDPLSPWIWLSGALVAGGILLVNRAQ